MTLRFTLIFQTRLGKEKANNGREGKKAREEGKIANHNQTDCILMVNWLVLLFEIVRLGGARL